MSKIIPKRFMLLAREDENKKKLPQRQLLYFYARNTNLFNSWFQELTPDQWHE